MAMREEDLKLFLESAEAEAEPSQKEEAVETQEETESQNEEEVSVEQDLDHEPQNYAFDKPLDEMSDDELRTLAETQGWKADYKGENAKSPREFLEKGEKELPILRKMVREMSAERKNFENILQKQREMVEKIVRKEIEEELSKTLEKKKAMEETGLYDKNEIEEYNRLNEKELKHKQELEQIEKEKQGVIPQQNLNEQKVIANFIKTKATWYQENPYLRSVAEVLAPTIAQENPNATIEERLEILDKLVRQNNPHLFQNPKRNEPNKVQSVNRNNAVATKTDIKKNYTFKDLNPADQRDFRVFEDMKFGLSQKPNETNDDFQKRVITEKQKLLNEYVSSYKE